MDSIIYLRSMKKMVKKSSWKSWVVNLKRRAQEKKKVRATGRTSSYAEG